MTGKEFLRRWRLDIVRGAVILGVVFGIGMLVVSMVGRGRAALNDFGHQFDTGFLAADRIHGQPWMYVKPLAPDRTLWLRNMKGSISVRRPGGRQLKIHAERTFKHSSADSVRIITAESDGGLTVCAMWTGSGSCGPDGHYNSPGHMNGNDAAAVFEVRLPRGVRLDASTVNGDVSGDGSRGPGDAGTGNGGGQGGSATAPIT